MSSPKSSPTFRLSQRAAWAEGQPISELMSRALAEPDLISLAAGFVDQQTLPVEPTRAAMESLLASEDGARAALQYGTTPGSLALREALLERFLSSDACCHDLSTDQLVVTAGSNQLLHLVSESILDPGDIVLCSAPTYFVYLGTLSNLGAQSLGVLIDQYGMVPEALEATLQRLRDVGQLKRVKAIYLVPYFDNPCGITMPLERRARIVEIAKRWSHEHPIHVIADEAYRDLHYEGLNVPSTLTVDDEGDTVIVTGTFSKSFSPGIRVGWGMLPRHLVGPVCSQKGNIDFGSPNFSQHLMAHVMQQGLLEPHLSCIRDGYRTKLRAMLTALDEHFQGIDSVRWLRPNGGLYVWMQLPDEIPASPNGPLFETAIQEGVLYVPGAYCYPTSGEPVRHNTLRLSFGVQTPERIREGIASLARAVRQVTAARRTESPIAACLVDCGRQWLIPLSGQEGNGIPPMSIFDRYLLRMFVKVLAISFTSLTGLFIVIDLFGNLEEFITYAERQGSMFAVLMEYYGARVLSFFERTSSLLALIAAIFTITYFHRSNELTAVMAAGISKARAIRVLIVATMFVALLAAANREFGLPSVKDKLSRNAQDWLGENAKQMTALRDHRTQILLGGKETIAAKQKIIQPIFRMPRTGPLLSTFGKQLGAATATYLPASNTHPNGYLLENVNQPDNLAQLPSMPEAEPIVITPADHDWLEDGQCFVVSEITFDHLVADRAWQQYASTSELVEALRNPSLEYGADTRVMVHRRFVQPILDVTLLFLGLPLVLARSQSNVFMAAAKCLLLVGVFFIVSLACQAMGNSVMISPALAAWLPLLIFAPTAYMASLRRWE